MASSAASLGSFRLERRRLRCRRQAVSASPARPSAPLARGAGIRGAHVSSAEDALAQAEELLARLDRARERLESTEDPETAIEVLGELNEIAKQIESAVSEAKRRAEAEADAEP